MKEYKQIYNAFYYAGVYNMITLWMEEFDKICPDFLKEVTINMPEIKFSANYVDINENLELKQYPNFFMLGDCSYARGIYQSALGGIHVANII